jgi:hypothetical protein
MTEPLLIVAVMCEAFNACPGTGLCVRLLCHTLLLEKLPQRHGDLALLQFEIMNM